MCCFAISGIVVIETGGVIIGIPARIISYFFARRFFLAVRERRLKRQRIDITKERKHD